MGTVKKSTEAIAVAWFFKNARQVWDGGGCTPERVLVGHAPDEIADLMRGTRPSPVSALPPPIEAESLAVPRDDRFGTNDGEGMTPVLPDVGKHDPYEAVAFLQADPGSRALQDIELVTQSGFSRARFSRDRNTERSRCRMILSIERRYRAVTLTASLATRTDY